MVSPFFGPEIGEDQKEKQGLPLDFYHKSVELWFHITIWCFPKWCHPKMMSPWESRPPPPTSYATAPTDEIKILILAFSTFILAIFHLCVMALFHCHDT